MNRIKNLWLAIGAILLVLLSCRPVDDLLGRAPTATLEPAEESATSVPSTATGASEPTSAPSPTEIPTDPPFGTDVPLSQEGPWLLFSSLQGLWAANPDGSGLTNLFPRPNLDYRILTATSPLGGRVAVLAFSHGAEISIPELWLLSLPSGDRQLITRLLPENFDLTSVEPEAIDLWAAVGVWNDVVWSTDGLHLAFNGAMDAPNADLYVYSLADDAIQRLSEHPAHSVRPAWSPDSRFIVYGAVEDILYHQGPQYYDVLSARVAHADGSDDHVVSSSVEYGFEEVIGWLSDSVFLSAAEDLVCFTSDLSVIDIEAGETRLIWEDNFGAVAFDPNHQSILFAVPQLLIDIGCAAEGSRGLYIHTTVEGATPLKIVEDSVNRLIWSPEANLFFAETDFGILAVDTAGQFIDLYTPQPSLGFPIVAPGSRQLAWTGGELWVGTLRDSLDSPPKQILDQPVWDAIWDLDGERLYFVTEGAFYMARSPEFAPVLIREDLSGMGFTWVQP